MQNNKEEISSVTEEEIVDKIVQLGEIYPVSKEELEEAIKKVEAMYNKE